MAIDFVTDLEALYAANVVGDAAYSAVSAANRDQLSEQRILLTIEILRSHIAELRDPAEARLLHYCLGRILAGIPMSGYNEARLTPQVVGTVDSPTFSANAAIDITTVSGTDQVLFAAGGALAAAIADINGDISNAVEVEAYNADGALGFRNTDGNKGASFTLATGTNGSAAAQIGTEAGITLGVYSGGTAQIAVAAAARDDALARFDYRARPIVL